MKYLVKESQVERMMWNYLNSSEYIILGGEHVGEIIFLREGTEDLHDYIYTFNDKRLLVETELVFGFAGLFDISPEDALEYIGDWFSRKYNLEVDEIVDWT
mgnify:FL=1|jgi:hypothetical protein